MMLRYCHFRAAAGARLCVFVLIALAHLLAFRAWHRPQLPEAGAALVYMTVWQVVAPVRVPATPRLPVGGVSARHPVAPALAVAPRPAPVVPPAPVLAAPTLAAEPSPPEAAAAPSPRPLDIEQLRRLAREDEAARPVSPLERNHRAQYRPHTIEATVADAARRGARRDCQHAYDGGLLALIPLVYDTLTDTGCKWK